MKTQNTPPKPLRAVIYARTSGEDFTSIDSQIEACKKFIDINKWQFTQHYVDECITGTKIEGRNSFKQMMKDAANGLFDIIAVVDINRFARAGFDIIDQTRLLKNTFDVDVIDTQGYDTRSRKNIINNYSKAATAEKDRSDILERTILRGRIPRAQRGLQWSPKPPFGRTFKKTGKLSGEWGISEDGKKMERILQAYVNEDKSFRELAREYGLKSGQKMTRLVREAQLAANPYIAVFNCPDIDIIDYKVEVPAVPPVITKELEKRVLAKMARNHKTKRHPKRNYLLSGMIRCAHCGKYLKGQSQRGRSYYTHNNFYADKKPCPYNGIRLEILESHVMDCLTNLFFDEPAFEAAVKNALPTIDDRTAIVKDIESNKKAQTKNSSKISNLVKAIAEGADVSLLLDTQEQLKAEKQALEQRAIELQETLDTMPDPDIIKAQARIIRVKLMISKLTENWQNRSYNDLRRFLFFLFSDNPRQNNYGMTLAKQDDKWHIILFTIEFSRFQAA